MSLKLRMKYMLVPKRLGQLPLPHPKNEPDVNGATYAEFRRIFLVTGIDGEWYCS